MTGDEHRPGSTAGSGSGDDGDAGRGPATDRLGEVTLPVGTPERVVYEAFEAVENAPHRADLPSPTVAVRYRPVVDVEAVTRARFETGGEVAHRIDSRDHLVVDVDADGPRLAPDDVVDLVGVEAVPLADARAEHGGEVGAFVGGEIDYREWVTERLCERLAEDVTFTDADGEPDVTTCRPSPADVSLRSLRSLYVPRVEAVVELGSYRHRYAYDAAGDRHAVREDGVRNCDNCETAGADAAIYAYCEHCGSISCEAHVLTERLTGDPVCTDCAVPESFPLTTKYFADEAARAAFREQYAAMSPTEKLREHLPCFGG